MQKGEKMEAFLKGQIRSKSHSSDKPSGSKAVGQKSERKSVPWVEKYRPRSVEEVAHQDEVVSVLKKCLQGADLPNLLFYGPPGTGKTSAILAAARQLFGVELFRARTLELNASDERGIQVVRDKVKTFAQQAVSATRPDGRPCPPFKIVILDEADSMTSSAQAALRRTMEKQSKTTRFCLICNYISRIIEPLTSRCSKFRFKPLASSVQTERLTYIAEQEKVGCQPQVIEAIVAVSDGDLRKAITYLQSATRLKGSEEITEDDISEIAGILPGPILESLLKACHSDSHDRLEACVKDVIAEGYSATQTISQLHDKVVAMESISDRQKSVMSERMGLVERRLMDGADEFLQLMDLCSVIMDQLCHAHTG